MLALCADVGELDSRAGYSAAAGLMLAQARKRQGQRSRHV
jgi:hypothetical protein